VLSLLPIPIRYHGQECLFDFSIPRLVWIPSPVIESPELALHQPSLNRKTSATNFPETIPTTMPLCESPSYNSSVCMLTMLGKGGKSFQNNSCTILAKIGIIVFMDNAMNVRFR
jgi:hypothetical protein